MKAVDIIVEEADRVSFIEFDYPDHPRAKQKDRTEFIDEFEPGKLDEELKYKYRDSSLSTGELPRTSINRSATGFLSPSTV